MSYKPDKKNPIELMQAEKAVELLARFDATTYDADTCDKAEASLAEARDAKGQKQIDAAKVTVTLAGQALSKTVQMKEAEEASKRAAESAASKQNLSDELETAQVLLAKTTSDLEQAQSEVKRLSTKNEKLTGQQQTFEQTLTGALGQMATGSKTDRGYVVSLSGVAFQSGQSQLSTEAKYVLAKLSGMLLVFPSMNMSVEGHTDSTGSDDVNRKLSQARAEAVSTFLSEMGVTKSRMTAAGFGPDNPIAPNDTSGGRAKNRRVDIIMTESQ
jgi:outer membrane protein OmpA-like peptidoglycan-associated protein